MTSRPTATTRSILDQFDASLGRLGTDYLADAAAALEIRDCRLNGGTGWSEIRKESDHD